MMPALTELGAQSLATRISVGRWVIEYDRHATAAAYARVMHGAPERCGCAPCRNFAAARLQAYPADAAQLLAELGIDHRKEAEVYHQARLAGGLHAYGGWFHLVGRIVSGRDAKLPRSDSIRECELERLTPRFSVGFTADAQLVPRGFVGSADLGLEQAERISGLIVAPVLQVEFAAEVPWVLGETPVD